MHRWMLLLILLPVLLGNSPPVSADQKQRREDLVRGIVASWRERQAKVKTLTASAKVESFYPKGYVSQPYYLEHPELAGQGTVPEGDTRFTDEPISWAIDFAKQRYRKEQDIATPGLYGAEGCELVPTYNLYLAASGKSQIWRPRHRYSKKSREAGAQPPDVCLYGEPSNAFLITFSDMPLLWVAGGVSGQFPDAGQSNRLDDVARFSYQGEGEYKGHKCVFLTVPEQHSPTAVREFWVGVNKPHPIHFCRYRDGSKVYWQIETEYRPNQQLGLIPSVWTYTGYKRGKPEWFLTQTFRLEKIEINEPLSSDLFEKALEPGMIVEDVWKNATFEVMPDGSLGPVRHPHKEGGVRRVWVWLGAVLAVLFALAFGWRYLRKDQVKRGT